MDQNIKKQKRIIDDEEEIIVSEIPQPTPKKDIIPEKKEAAYKPINKPINIEDKINQLKKSTTPITKSNNIHNKALSTGKSVDSSKVNNIKSEKNKSDKNYLKKKVKRDESSEEEDEEYEEDDSYDR
jgi:hypothetical protein